MSISAPRWRMSPTPTGPISSACSSARPRTPTATHLLRCPRARKDLLLADRRSQRHVRGDRQGRGVELHGRALFLSDRGRHGHRLQLRSISMGPEKTVDGSGLERRRRALDRRRRTCGSAPRAAPQPTWIQFAFDKTYKLDKMLVWNSNQVLESILGLRGQECHRGVLHGRQPRGRAVGDFEFAQAQRPGAYTADIDRRFRRRAWPSTSS